MFRTVLIPLDGSPLAEQALPAGFALARAAQGTVILLRSLIPPHTLMPLVTDDYGWLWPESARAEALSVILGYLEEVKHQYACPGCDVRLVAVEGDPATAIVDAAGSEPVDLIVMSTHGQGGWQRAVFGSVTERVLDASDRPVLVARSRLPITRLIIALDGSAVSELALQPALELAAQLGAEVTLLRVCDQVINGIAVSVPGEAGILPGELEALQREIRRSAEAYLAELALHRAPAGVNVLTAVVEGDPAERILSSAREQGADLIAMCTHGRTGLSRWLYGSVTSKVLRGSDCSMLIVRPQAEQAEAAPPT